MLHISAVRLPSTLELLIELMRDELLNEVFLVGGTALALQFGHRVSVDLDLFSQHSFSSDKIIGSLSQYLSVEIRKKQDENLLILNVSNPKSENLASIKVDFLRYPHQILDKIIHEDGIRLLSYLDIAPMKLAAINGRGAKKDFFDLYFLLNKHSYDEELPCFNFCFLCHFYTSKGIVGSNNRGFAKPD